eukprot:1415536-Alexandrium_andersonii.AAC.1
MSARAPPDTGAPTSYRTGASAAYERQRHAKNTPFSKSMLAGLPEAVQQPSITQLETRSSGDAAAFNK